MKSANCGVVEEPANVASLMLSASAVETLSAATDSNAITSAFIVARRLPLLLWASHQLVFTARLEAVAICGNHAQSVLNVFLAATSSKHVTGQYYAF